MQSPTPSEMRAHIAKVLDANTTGLVAQGVSWVDASRGSVASPYTASGYAPSSVGKNIADMWVVQEGQTLTVIRPPNLNERVGTFDTREFAIMENDPASHGTLRTTTLASYLQKNGLYNAQLDGEAELGVETVFVQVGAPGSATDTAQLCTKVLSYDTRSRLDPQNLIIVASLQGTSIGQNEPGANPVFLRSFDLDGAGNPAVGLDGKLIELERMLDVEASPHKVGGEQRDTDEQRADARARGKAESARLGLAAFGQHSNILMSVQVPRVRTPLPPSPTRGVLSFNSSGVKLLNADASMGPPPKKLCAKKGGKSLSADDPSDDDDQSVSDDQPVYRSMSAPSGDDATDLGMDAGALRSLGADVAKTGPKAGIANAARASLGRVVRKWGGLGAASNERANQKIRVQITFYHTVSGGLPSPTDIMSAVADMKAAYAACKSAQTLQESIDKAPDKHPVVTSELKSEIQNTLKEVLAPSYRVIDPDGFPTHALGDQ